MKLNLPNKLTLLRVIMIPFFMFFIIFPELLGSVASAVIATALFILTALTDMLDGKIARKYNLITNFGKFLDPLADKVMILGGFIALLCVASERGVAYTKFFAVSFFLILFRELAVTSMRLVVSDCGNVVVAANWMGKCKTVLQTVTMVVLILEPVILPDFNNILSYVFLGASVVLTVWSGINYFVAYWPYLDPTK